MRRRGLLASALAGATVLAAPRVVRADAARVLKFIPQSDLATLDPHFTTASVTREHGFLVFDTLYGMDNAWQAQPQMVAGQAWTMPGRRNRRWSPAMLSATAANCGNSRCATG
jgi:peptide/nickel transport system substrate-binding protein